jgi:hypothetical protein
LRITAIRFDLGWCGHFGFGIPRRQAVSGRRFR